jgi:hypothetical protein
MTGVAATKERICRFDYFFLLFFFFVVFFAFLAFFAMSFSIRERMTCQLCAGRESACATFRLHEAAKMETSSPEPVDRMSSYAYCVTPRPLIPGLAVRNLCHYDRINITR